jgi:hypothetical protein
VGDLVECAVHFRAPGGFIGLVLMGVKRFAVSCCRIVSFSLESECRTVY